MDDKRFDDFVRFIRKFCKEQGIELKEEAKSGPHCCFVLFAKDGGRKIKIERFVVRSDKKDMKQRTLRKILAHNRSNLDKKRLSDSSQRIIKVLKELVGQLERWMSN